MGVSGAGKSTLMHALALRLHWRSLEADDLHSAANIDKMRHGVPLDEADRQPWLAAIAAVVASWARDGVSGVVACSALSRDSREQLRAAAESSLLVYLEANLRLVVDRVQHRPGHFMPATLAGSQFDALEPPAIAEQPVTVRADQPIDQMVQQVVTALAERTAGSRDDPAAGASD
jgi:gluconokinase